MMCKIHNRWHVEPKCPLCEQTKKEIYQLDKEISELEKEIHAPIVLWG